MEILKINRNLKFIPRKEVPHKLRNYVVHQFIGIRKNYYIMNNNYRKRNFTEILKLIKHISYKNPNTVMITEFPELRFTTRRTLIQKNEWIPGSLLRFYCTKKRGELRKLPLLMINISNEERTIPILEALKINISTFSFTTLKRRTFILSDFSYPINFNKKRFSDVVLDVIITNIINSKYNKNLYFKDTLEDIYKKIKTTNIINKKQIKNTKKVIRIIRKKYLKIYKKQIIKGINYIKYLKRRERLAKLRRKNYINYLIKKRKPIAKLRRKPIKIKIRSVKSKNRYNTKIYFKEKKRKWFRRYYPNKTFKKPKYLNKNNKMNRKNNAIFKPKYGIKRYNKKKL